MVLPLVDWAWAEQPSAETSKTPASLIMLCLLPVRRTAKGPAVFRGGCAGLEESYASGFQFVIERWTKVPWPV
jgi:hypothetical protein